MYACSVIGVNTCTPNEDHSRDRVD